MLYPLTKRACVLILHNSSLFKILRAVANATNSVSGIAPVYPVIRYWILYQYLLG